MLIAVTRDPGASLGRCELTFLPRERIDTELAREQHERYEAALGELGCRLIRAPAAPGLADAVFVEDTAVVLDEVAIMCRPGAASRRPEVDGIAGVLGRFRPLARITAPGTLDGGDVLRAGKSIWVGRSSRTNREGIGQLRASAGQYGYAVRGVEVGHCLHLKSAVTAVAGDTLLINPGWVDAAAFGDYRLVEVDPREPDAANSLLVGDTLIFPSKFPRTLDRLAARGIEVVPVDVGELQKAEGGVSCCSLVFEAADE